MDFLELAETDEAASAIAASETSSGETSKRSRAAPGHRVRTFPDVEAEILRLRAKGIGITAIAALLKVKYAAVADISAVYEAEASNGRCNGFAAVST